MTPISQPAAAIRSEKPQASSTVVQSGSPRRPVAGSPSRVTMSQMCGIARSPVRGVIARPPTTRPFAGPNAL